MSPSRPVSSRVRPQIAIVGAASSIGIRPYDDGRPRHLDRAPAALRELGLVERLRAEDFGDVTPPPYRDFIRPPGRVRNEDELGWYIRAVADRVGHAVTGGHFVLLLGGDCSIILGSLLGVARHAGAVGLAYIDGHADFASVDESQTGSAASMCLALAVGRGDSPLAHLAGDVPLVRAADVVLIGRRDAGQSYGHDALSSSGVLDIPGDVLVRDGARAVAARTVERLERAAPGGFWIHVDADVIDPRLMPAVDSPEPGGLDIDDLAALLVPLIRHPGALGLQLTIYDPALDPDRSCGRRLVALLETVLADRVAVTDDAGNAGGEA